jgi:hypothetical protein
MDDVRAQIAATGKYTKRFGGGGQGNPCGEASPAREPRPKPRNPLGCVHLLEQLDRSVEQTGCGCAGNRLTSVWGCELFAAVAPFAKGTPVDPAVVACRACERYEAPRADGPPDASD